MRFALLAFAFLLAACAPSAPAPPKPTQSIAEADAAFRKAVEAKDADAAAAFFVDEVKEPGAISFGEAMRQSLKTLAADANGKAVFRPTGPAATSATGDLAYTIGVLDWIATYPEARTPLARSSSYILLWRLQPAGTWKIVRVATTETPYESPYRRYENSDARRTE